MTDSLTVTMLPAKEGDCLHIAYGEQPNRKHILIDAGRKWTWRNALKPYLADNGIQQVELLVVTHVDRDHIDGMLAMVTDPDLDLDVKEFWFNTWDHLLGNAITPQGQGDDETEHFGAKMGEELSTHCVKKRWPWNKHFKGRPVEISDDPAQNIIELDDVTLTLLSPSREKLEDLKVNWKKECEKAGLTPGSNVEDYVIDDDDIEEFGPINIEQLAAEPFEEDHSKANGSSIAFILQYKDARVLLAGDAHTDLLSAQLRKLGATAEQPIRLNVFKVPHHASKYNVSIELLELMDCDHFLISTNGNYFKHPEKVAVARLIKYGTAGSVLNFNYQTDYSSVWQNGSWETSYRYSTRYPDDARNGFLVFEVPCASPD